MIDVNGDPTWVDDLSPADVPDWDDRVPDLAAEADDDVVALHAAAPHLLDDLDPLERAVVSARFGLDGEPERSMKQLQRELRRTHTEVRDALGAGLAKIRRHFAA